jgi:glycosyltransferase involved in cell wall biosynthesis
MNILFDNVNLTSTSGPNNFAKKLASQISEDDDNFVLTNVNSENIDVQLSFIQSNFKIAPTALRLDGIYFNTSQNWKELNSPIQKSFKAADAVIYQSHFNQKLVEKYFGTHTNAHVVHNGTKLDWIDDIPPLDSGMLNNFAGVWSCASSWRPHKRLEENVKYFLEHAPDDRCLIIAGPNPDYQINDPRIFYSGPLDWNTLIALYKRSETFLHLAYLDHCPNVVVDARAAGCHVVCSSTGGTKEIAGKNATIVVEEEWGFEPIKLYEPPPMNFNDTISSTSNPSVDVKDTALKYVEILQEIREDS